MSTPFQQLVEKCLTDPGFRKQFLSNRVEAYKSLGLPDNPMIEKALNNLDTKSIVNLAIAMQGPGQFT